MASTKKVRSVEIDMGNGQVETVNLNKKSTLNKRERTGYAFVIPYVVVFLIFSLYPILRTFWLSFQKVDVKIVSGTTYEFAGFKYYNQVLQDPTFRDCFINTIKIWLLNIILQLGLAFLLTIIFVDIKYKIRGLAIYRAVYYLPNIIAATSLAFLFMTLLDERFGTVNILLSTIFRPIVGHNILIKWLGVDLCFATIGVIQAWMWFGNSFIMLMAGVMGISRDYYEASAIDGAGRWAQFTKITLPLLKPIMLYVGVTSLIGGLQMFDLPNLIATDAAVRKSVRTVIMYLYDFAFGTLQDSGKAVSRAAAAAYILFAVILVISAIQFAIMRDKDKED